MSSIVLCSFKTYTVSKVLSLSYLNLPISNITENVPSSILSFVTDSKEGLFSASYFVFELKIIEHFYV